MSIDICGLIGLNGHSGIQHSDISTQTYRPCFAIVDFQLNRRRCELKSPYGVLPKSKYRLGGNRRFMRCCINNLLKEVVNARCIWIVDEPI